MKTEEQNIPKGYPRTYHIDASARRFVYGLGIFLIGLFLGVTPLHLLGLFKKSLDPLSLALMDALVIAVVIWACMRVNRRVILYEDAIELAQPFSRRRLGRDEILGRRTGQLPVQAGGSSYYIIVPADGNQRELKMPAFLHVDKCFHS
jgi:hypothetical protein